MRTSLLALSCAFVGLLQACTPFRGKDADANVVDMATADAMTDAAVDASDAGADASGRPPKVFPPPAACSGTFPFAVVTASRGMFEVANASEAAAIDEPFCACVPPATEGDPVRWATCGANESDVETCRANFVCPSTEADARGFACNFDLLIDVDNAERPSCSSMQYPVETCASCAVHEACAVYASGAHTCVMADEELERRGGVFALDGRFALDTANGPQQHPWR